MRRTPLVAAFYLLLSLVYPAIISLIFMAHVAVTDEQYFWWTNHSPVIIAAHLLPFQWAVHRYFVPMYSWSFRTTELAKIGAKVRSRAQIPELLKEMAEQGIYLSTIHESLVAKSRKIEDEEANEAAALQPAKELPVEIQSDVGAGGGAANGSSV